MKYINIGFTGNQMGMTASQKLALADTVQSILEIENSDAFIFHHGVCIGSDYEAHHIVYEMQACSCITLHPPINTSKMSPVLNLDYDLAEFGFRSDCFIDIRPPLEYLDRNKQIVDESAWLIATPKEYAEQLRSGTWSTVRYASRQEVPTAIIYPDGQVRLSISGISK